MDINIPTRKIEQEQVKDPVEMLKWIEQKYGISLEPHQVEEVIKAYYLEGSTNFPETSLKGILVKKGLAQVEILQNEGTIEQRAETSSEVQQKPESEFTPEQELREKADVKLTTPIVPQSTAPEYIPGVQGYQLKRELAFREPSGSLDDASEWAREVAANILSRTNRN